MNTFSFATIPVGSRYTIDAKTEADARAALLAVTSARLRLVSCRIGPPAPALPAVRTIDGRPADTRTDVTSVAGVRLTVLTREMETGVEVCVHVNDAAAPASRFYTAKVSQSIAR